ncbi:MAG TPA: CoA transferase [Acetobacteraceae bacterium]|jgi:crotonobetainyl-CoA:carnitine CoA-transferase CaiB-like acyl-CoA transferase|nr:CoA transferase [Acetobacteraceae bacterium]
MPGPLHGIRILDLTGMISGPMATMILADQGADVIKIEPPAGDLMRHYGVMRKGMSSSFLSNNHGKRSLAVDIKSSSGLEIVLKLAATADVLVQNFRPGAIERMGLGEDVVRAVKPDIIFVSISGFGEHGPYAAQRVYDPVIQALSGLAEIQADRQTGQPRMVRTVIPDKTTAVTAAQAVTAALFSRERTGQGQHVRLAMLDTMVAYLWPEASSSLSFVGDEADPARGQMGLDLVFKTRDRYITAGAVSDAEWQGMCHALERPDLIEDERFNTVAARSSNVIERRALMNAELSKWPSADILDRLQAENVPCAPVLSRTEVLTDAQVIINGIIEVHEDAVLGSVRQPRPAARFSATPAAVRRLAPYLGADNREIMTELGYSTADIERLTEAGVLHAKPPPGVA